MEASSPYDIMCEDENGFETFFLKSGTVGTDGTGGIMYMKGNVGIGTNNPFAKLHVNGYRHGDIASGTWSSIWWAESGGHYFGNPGFNFNQPLSIYATNYICTNSRFISGQGSFTHSDSRIKRDIEEVDDDEALVKLRQIEPKTYGYKDKGQRGNDNVIGFIADEVEEVLPEAVKKTTATIPNILEMSIVAHSNIITFTNFNTSNLNSNTSIECVDVRSGDEQFITIVKVIDDKTIQVKEDLSEWLGSFDETGNLVVDTTTSTLTLEEYEALDLDKRNGYVAKDDVYEKEITSYPGNNLYIRGERVNDFRTLKKEMLFAINFSATQAIDRQLQAEKVRNDELQVRLQALEARIQALE